MAATEPKQLKVEAQIDAELDLVWEAWTSPEQITRWNFAIDTWHCPRASNDLRVGGRYAARMEAKDGSFGFDFEADYTEVRPRQKLTYKMTDGRVASTDFVAKGNQTWVCTVFDAETENSLEMQQQGWQAILNNFKSYVESQARRREA